MDAWFIGYTSKLVIGVYVGFDEPKSLGRYETGAKAALPIFKKFVKNVIKKRDALPFKVPKNINFVMVDVDTGLPPNEKTKEIIYESFKTNDNFVYEPGKLYNDNEFNLYDSKKTKQIFKFY